MADEDGDGRLDFEEFFRLSQEHDWLMGHYVARYCQWLVPDPHRSASPSGQAGSPDQIGEQLYKLIFFIGYGNIFNQLWAFLPGFPFISFGDWEL